MAEEVAPFGVSSAIHFYRIEVDKKQVQSVSLLVVVWDTPASPLGYMIVLNEKLKTAAAVPYYSRPNPQSPQTAGGEVTGFDFECLLALAPLPQKTGRPCLQSYIFQGISVDSCATTVVEVYLYHSMLQIHRIFLASELSVVHRLLGGYVTYLQILFSLSYEQYERELR